MYDLDGNEIPAFNGFTLADLDSLCMVCLAGTDEDRLLLCDGRCGQGAHTHCVGLTEIPAGEWFCAGCRAKQEQPVHLATSRNPDSEPPVGRASARTRAGANARIRPLRRRVISVSSLSSSEEQFDAASSSSSSSSDDSDVFEEADRKHARSFQRGRVKRAPTGGQPRTRSRQFQAQPIALASSPPYSQAFSLRAHTASHHKRAADVEPTNSEDEALSDQTASKRPALTPVPAANSLGIARLGAQEGKATPCLPDPAKPRPTWSSLPLPKRVGSSLPSSTTSLPSMPAAPRVESVSTSASSTRVQHVSAHSAPALVRASCFTADEVARNPHVVVREVLAALERDKREAARRFNDRIPYNNSECALLFTKYIVPELPKATLVHDTAHSLPVTTRFVFRGIHVRAAARAGPSHRCWDLLSVVSVFIVL